MIQKVPKSISVEPEFWLIIQNLAKKHRLTASTVIEEALKEVILCEHSVLLDNILKRTNNGTTH